MKLFVRICLGVTAICLLVGFSLLAASFIISPELASTVRSHVLFWHGGLIAVVGASYVLIHHATTQDITPRQAEVNALAHCPRALKLASYAIMLLGVIAFFGSIWLVESHRIDRSVGEAAILGAFTLLLSSSVFARLWSTLARL